MWPSSSLMFHAVHRVGLAKSSSERSRAIFETSPHSSARASRGSAIADRIAPRLLGGLRWAQLGEQLRRVIAQPRPRHAQANEIGGPAINDRNGGRDPQQGARGSDTGGYQPRYWRQ